MINETIIGGYCTIKKDADCGFSMGKPSDWQGKDVRVLEFADHSQSVMVVTRDGRLMGTFDYKDLYRKFKCIVHGDVIMDPGLNVMQQMAYTTRVYSRKGGYNNLLREMVIKASLMKGEFTDNILFQKERDDNREMQMKYGRLRKIIHNHRMKRRTKKPRKERRLLKHLSKVYRPSLAIYDEMIQMLGSK